MNEVHGFLVETPEAKEGKNGKTYCKFKLRVSYPWREGDDVFTLPLIAFGKAAQDLIDMKDEDPISVKYRLQTNQNGYLDVRVLGVGFAGIEATKSPAGSNLNLAKQDSAVAPEPVAATTQDEIPF